VPSRPRLDFDQHAGGVEAVSKALLALEHEMLQPSRVDPMLLARLLDVGDQRAQKRRQRAPARLGGVEHGPGLEPHRHIETAALALPRDVVHDARPGHEHRRRDTDPQQRHDWESQDLSEREESVLQGR
jgi:hypothetical protein